MIRVFSFAKSDRKRTWISHYNDVLDRESYPAYELINAVSSDPLPPSLLLRPRVDRLPFSYYEIESQFCNLYA